VSAAFAPLVVRNSRGEQVDLGDAQVEPDTRSRVSVSLKPLPDGLYTAVYRVTSLDGHLAQGTIAFTVGQTPATVPGEQAPPAQVPAGVSLVHGLTQWSAVLLAGLPLFLMLVWWPLSEAVPPGLRRWAAGISLLLVGSGLAELTLYTLRASGAAWSVPLLFRTLTGTRVGLLWLIRIGLGLLAAGALTRRTRPGSRLARALYALPGIGLLLTFSLQSHAMATGRFLPVLADWLHLLAAAPWVGGLAGFALVVWPLLAAQPPEERARWLGALVPRFSQVATVSVLLLTVTGIYSARLHVPGWEALWSTSYGRALDWKLILLLPVLGLALYNRRRQGCGLFRLAVGAELFLVFGVFLAAGFLTSLPPAKVEVALRQGPFAETAQADGLTIALKITPNRLGFNQAVIRLTGPDGHPIAGASTGLRVTMVAHEMGLQNLDATEQAPGTYTVGDLILGMPGEWRVEVVTLTKGGREVRHTFRVVVPAPPEP
jgi:copper transport protein